MKTTKLTRRDFSVRLGALLPVLGIAEGASGLSGPQVSYDPEGISHSCDCIHQEVVFKATRKRVYDAITDEKQFYKVMDFVMKGASTQISHEVGGAFSMFGGVIVGRHIELVPYERIVQAWREKDWDAGVYSVVRFQLNEQGSGTKLVFDHTSFPQGAGVHLAPGWKTHYWVPLEKYLG
jgi:activator of HSP90 ATPase